MADINPVAWFILRCTLHYPRLLAGEARPLPSFALRDRAFVEEFLKAHGVTKENAVREELVRYGHGDGEAVQVAAPFGSASACPAAGADFAWHLRAWGRRVLAGARRALAARCPTYAGFEQAIATVSAGRAVPRKSGGQSMPSRESVSVKRPCRFAGTQCGGRPARVPRSARESPEGSSEPARYRQKKPSPWGTKCLYPHSHPGISKTCGQRARLPEGGSSVGDLHRPGRGAGGPFLREGGLMTQLHCSGSIVGGCPTSTGSARWGNTTPGGSVAGG